MATVLFYNPGSQHIMEADERDQEKLENSGFRKVERYDLVAVYHPGLNQHKTVLKSDVQTWLNQGYYAEPTIVYHPEKGKLMVSAEQARELYTQGWVDSPAKFKLSTLVGASGKPLVLPAEKPAASSSEPESSGEREGQKEKPLSRMKKAELAQHYFDTFGETLDAEMSRDDMLAAIEARAQAAA